MRWLALISCLAASPAAADALVAARTLRPGTIIESADVATSDQVVPGALSRADEVVGQEVRIAIYAGRPLRPGDIGPPALVERNEIVPLTFRRGPLRIVTEGRALGRGGAGDMIRVMNITSRTTVNAVVGADGAVQVVNGSGDVR